MKIQASENTQTFNELPDFYPVPVLELGQAILDQVCTDNEDLADFLNDLSDRHGEDFIGWILVKFGLITSAATSPGSDSLAAPKVARRILQRAAQNHADFQAAFLQVLDEETRALEANRAAGQDLVSFEERTFEEIHDLWRLSGNPVFLDLLNFIRDLDGIFSGRSFLFNYLDYRYSQFQESGGYNPQTLAVQMATDYLAYREIYQIGIIAEYEDLIKSYGADPLVTMTQAASNLNTLQ